ncbi:MAG: hypothetical protein WCX88_00280 [Patescibacteria group bacterium]
MFDEGKKISLLPREDQLKADEHLAKIKKGTPNGSGVDLFMPQKEKIIESKNKKNEHDFWSNLISGVRHFFSSEANVHKEKIVPQYNLPETKIEKEAGAHRVKLIEPKEHVFSSPDKKEAVFGEFEKNAEELKAKKIEKNEIKKNEEHYSKIDKIDFSHEDSKIKKTQKNNQSEIDLDNFLNSIIEEPRNFEKPEADKEKNNAESQNKINKMGLSQADFQDDEDAVEISLVPKFQKRAESYFKQNLIYLFVWIFVCLVFIGGLYWFAVVRLTDLSATRANLENKKQEIQSELAKMGVIQRKVQVLEDKLKESKNLLDNHIYWTNLFTALEKYTHSQVSYTGFSGTIGKELVLKATAPSYSVAARQLLIFQSAKEIANDVTISEISQKINSEDKTSQVSFSLTLTLNPEVFKYKNN